MLTHREQATTLRYAFVSTGMSKIIGRMRRGIPFSTDDVETLGRGKEFICAMRQGAHLLIDGETTPGYSPESLPAIDRAVTTLSSLKMARNRDQVKRTLESLEGTLDLVIGAASSSQQLDPSCLESRDVESLEQFFHFLARQLTEESVGSSFGSDIEIGSWNSAGA